MVTPEEKRYLTALARSSIALGFRVRGMTQVPLPPALSDPHGGRLMEPGGAFVTLRIGRDLRGCIGYIESALPLVEVVAEVAPKAAFDDPRFAPLTPEEFPLTHIEISILSPLKKVGHISEIQVGTHGILLELGNRRGLLLPQVATDYGWDRETFLQHTARKAGLPPDAWKDPSAGIHIFSAEIVEEVRHA